MRTLPGNIRDWIQLGATVSVYELTPLEYRVALDAASMWLACYPALKLRCEQPALLPEVQQRLLAKETMPPWSSGLWIEPQIPSWRGTLTEFSQQLASNCRLAVLLSLPAARRLSERGAWSGDALGEQGGLGSFLQALPAYGFTLDTDQGLHSGQSVFFNTAALLARKLGRFALADRLEFAARKCYIQPICKAWGITCALVLAERQ